jgi:hypothetical protein
LDRTTLASRPFMSQLSACSSAFASDQAQKSLRSPIQHDSKNLLATTYVVTRKSVSRHTGESHPCFGL